MKIKNAFLAQKMKDLGFNVTAELVIDDSNGTSLTFPDISDIAEIDEGVAVDALDGTYVIADGDSSITVVVASGAVTSATKDEPVASTDPNEVGEEVQAVLTAVVEALKTQKADFTALLNRHNALVASLKHEEEKPGAAAASTPVESKYKIV